MMNINSPPPRLRRPAPAARLSALLIVSAGTVLPAFGQKLFYENFDGVPLGPNVEEASPGSQVWTKTPPTGWTIDDTGMPGFGQPDYAANDGRREWSGWSFADVTWRPTVDNQRRSEFTRASGALAAADPDEWDDATHFPGLFNSFLSTPEINVAGKAANSLVLAFDSSWRPECCDDGAPNFPVDENGSPTNNQTAVITAQWDGGTPVEIVRWDSILDGPYWKPDNDFINEAALATLNNPAGAQKLILKFGLINAANDWWWAIDNVAVGEPPFVTGIAATGIGVTVRITEALGKTVSTTPAITATLDGQPITVTTSTETDVVVVQYDQSPALFVPRSQHNIQVSYSTSDGRQVTDGGDFTAPGYTRVISTPTQVTATITETDYLTVNESTAMTLEIDGTAVTGQTVERIDNADTPDQIIVRYTAPAPFASASAHTLKLTFTTQTAQQVVETLSFTTPAYVTLPAAIATAAGTGADAGMKWRTHQLAAARPGGENLAEVEKQLRGELGPSIHDTSSETGGFFEISYVNFDQAPADAGNFTSSSAIAEQVVADDAIPGIPGTEGGDDNIAGEATAFVEIPAAGVYTMVVNSDDGFQVSAGTTNNPTYLVLGKFDAGRGAADTSFYFRVDQAGVYLFRLIWFEGGSGASVEWFTVDAQGKRALVNGPETGVTPLKAFRRRTVAEPELPGNNNNISAVARQGGQVVITYTGTLKSAEQVGGPYTDVAGATSPYSANPTGSQRFYIAQ